MAGVGRENVSAANRGRRARRREKRIWRRHRNIPWSEDFANLNDAGVFVARRFQGAHKTQVNDAAVGFPSGAMVAEIRVWDGGFGLLGGGKDGAKPASSSKAVRVNAEPKNVKCLSRLHLLLLVILSRVALFLGHPSVKAWCCYFVFGG